MRKSAQDRVSDVRRAIEQWTSAGLGRDRRVTFMRDSLLRLERGKGLTAKQRTWLDALCADGPPAPKGDPELLSRLDAAVNHLDEREATVLRDMRGRIVNGWSLSEKQSEFMERLIAQGERVAREGKWQPSQALRAEGLFAASVVQSRSSTWRGTHPGTVLAADRIVSDTATEWMYTKVIDAVGPAVREWHKPKFAEGELVWLSASWLPPWAPGGNIPPGTMALVTGGPEAYLGDVGYPVLVGEKAVVINGKVLTRRSPKGPL